MWYNVRGLNRTQRRAVVVHGASSNSGRNSFSITLHFAYYSVEFRPAVTYTRRRPSGRYAGWPIHVHDSPLVQQEARSSVERPPAGASYLAGLRVGRDAIGVLLVRQNTESADGRDLLRSARQMLEDQLSGYVYRLISPLPTSIRHTQLNC